MKIWIDLENTPHIPFFKPIIAELERRGHTVVLTARDAFQVCELATRSGLTFKQVGRHYGKSRWLKAWGLAVRTLQLIPFVLRERPALGLSHGARAQIVLCNLLRIPTVMVMDYEHAQTPWIVRPGWEIVPELLLKEDLHCRNRERILAYPGIKEDVYVPDFKPEAGLPRQLGFGSDDIVATVRPPATEAHYHNPESELLFVEFMNRAVKTPRVKVVLLPRNKAQENHIREGWPQWFKDAKVMIPREAVDGLNLLWYSDLVVSGGGTMNREAAALGVPVYSIFRGKSGAVDRHLESVGKLTLIGSVEELHSRISLQRRSRTGEHASRSREALRHVVDHVEAILNSACPQPAAPLATSKT